VVIVAHTFDYAGHKRTGISDPVKLCQFRGWCGDVFGVAIDTLAQAGNVDRDGALTSTDAMMALQIAAGRREYDSAADANRDGQVTSYDALRILRATGGA